MITWFIKGLGDFAVVPYQNCGINEAAITALAYVDICGSTICNLLLLRYFIVRCLKKKKLFFMSKDPRSLFPLLFLLHGIGDFLFAVLKVSYDVRPIVGKDLSVTIIAVFLPLFCYIGLVLYYAVIISFLRGYSRMMRTESRLKVDIMFVRLSKYAQWIPPIAFLPCIMPAIGLIRPEYTDIFGTLYLLGNGILALFYGLLFNFALGFLLQELYLHLDHLKSSGGGDSNDIQLVYDRLYLAYRIGSVGFVVIGFSYIIFGSWQVLLQMSSYLFLIIQIVVHPTFTILILTVSQISRSQSKVVPARLKQLKASDGMDRSIDSHIDYSSRSPSLSRCDGHILDTANATAEMRLELHLESCKA